MNWRIWATAIILILSFIDIGATFYYVQKYTGWQPDKPLKLIENNPLLVFLWGQLGIILGTVVGAAVIWTLLYILGKSAHWIVIVLVMIFLLYALFNHYTNINLLQELMKLYPSGHLPSEIFGNVEGNR